MTHPIKETYDSQFFRTAINEHFKHLGSITKLEPTPLEQGEVSFVSILRLIPGQDQISYLNAFEKLRAKYKKWQVTWDDLENKYKLFFDKGRSLLPQNRPIKVLSSPDGLLIVDGHHHVVMSLFVGASKIPVYVMGKIPALSIRTWKRLIERKTVYFKNSAPEILAAKTPKITRLTDNPFRYLASRLALKTKISYKEGLVTVQEKKGSKNALWIKINEGFPFVEFYIAEIIQKAGITFDPKWGEKIPPKICDEIRSALIKASQNQEQTQGFPIHKILMIDSSEQSIDFLNSNQKLKNFVIHYLTQHDMPLSVLQGTLHRLLERHSTHFI